MKKLKVWEGQPASKLITIKVDGIQVMRGRGTSVISRASKPLFNIAPDLLEPGARYEVFVEDFETTKSIVSTYDHRRKVTANELFRIWPDVDPRLVLLEGPQSVAVIEKVYKQTLKKGFEGLVIDQMWKLKPDLTFDVPVIGVVPGTGENEGLMGSLITPMGKVGVGFTRKERAQPWPLGTMIEVKCMGLTKDGKFRQPRFVRDRFDKA